MPTQVQILSAAVIILKFIEMNLAIKRAVQGLQSGSLRSHNIPNQFTYGRNMLGYYSETVCKTRNDLTFSRTRFTASSGELAERMLTSFLLSK